MTEPAPEIGYDDPGDLAALVAAAPRPILIGLDIDGVLAPIVAHADDSRLLDGVVEALDRVSSGDRVTIAAVSGRALASMRVFGLPGCVRLVGSHGLDEDGRPMTALDSDEVARLISLRHLADDAARLAGDGAWVEAKPASVVLHVREAADDLAAVALGDLANSASSIDGAEVKPGSRVLELFARPASKGTAMRRLAAETGAATSVFVGDDVTDEDAFAVLGRSDILIKVGDADTIATHRLADPDDVLAWLDALATRVG